MQKNDALSAHLDDLRAALALLTRLPLPDAPLRGARAVWAYPLAGVVVGLIAGLVGLIAHWGGLPSALAALAALAVQVIITGAMHEDGLADSADGLWGAWTRAKRLEIMKDSHMGAFGVIALFLALAARWAALWVLFQMGGGWALAAIVTAAAVSRAAMPLVMWALPHARASGLSHGIGRPDARTCAVAAGIAAVIALVLVGWSVFGVVIWAALTTVAVGWIAKDKIGGQTGDILGATQQLVEIAVLLSIIA
ncbi:adenosylcobinamide-GDP ribazoletransferase [Roseovarius sp. Pro17]|uniref:adenosylcobinamide-GDP ribazoletransferase n=1 Tax=Roseovarius sp. Pro17 TaxID=3108175 RepID=UPI002D76FEE2|nr:adenosylcobinamide-GDP ribazoletransferase [Roseovarius sp. Pro17]